MNGSTNFTTVSFSNGYITNNGFTGLLFSSDVTFNGNVSINVTSNGFVKTTGSNGTFTIDTTTYAPLASPTFTGTVTIPTLVLGTTTAGFVKTSNTGAISYDTTTYAPLASPTFTGTVTIPTLKLGSTAGFVKTASNGTIIYDSNIYLTTSAASSTYLPLSGGTVSGTLTVSSTNNIIIDATGTNTNSNTSNRVIGFTFCCVQAFSVYVSTKNYYNIIPIPSSTTSPYIYYNPFAMTSTTVTSGSNTGQYLTLPTTVGLYKVTMFFQFYNPTGGNPNTYTLCCYQSSSAPAAVYSTTPDGTIYSAMYDATAQTNIQTQLMTILDASVGNYVGFYLSSSSTNVVNMTITGNDFYVEIERIS